MSEQDNFDVNFADSVARLCFEKFASLPKSGKPILGKEWSLLSAIIKHAKGCSQIISIASGSKCIGRSKMSPKGDVLNDSHAEVLARRGFMRYLYEEIKILRSSGKCDILTIDENSGKYVIRDGVTFHLLTSHVPCGDASIFPKKTIEIDSIDQYENASNVSKRLMPQDEKNVKKFKFDYGSSTISCIPESPRSTIPDINRTGAKCLPHDVKQDKKEPGVDYHVVGIVRTKPGRGDPTLSMSCSDKILRWNCVGIEGALLSLFFLRPIRLSSIIVAGPPDLYCENAMNRAVIERNEYIKKMNQDPPILLNSNLEFEYNKKQNEPPLKPSPCGIIWCDVAERNHEVCVEGRRLGWTKKKSDIIEPLLIARKQFLRVFKSLNPGIYDDGTYFDIKLEAVRYREMNEKFKSAVGTWTIKNNDLQLFK